MKKAVILVGIHPISHYLPNLRPQDYRVEAPTQLQYPLSTQYPALLLEGNHEFFKIFYSGTSPENKSSFAISINTMSIYMVTSSIVTEMVYNLELWGKNAIQFLETENGVFVKDKTLHE